MSSLKTIAKSIFPTRLQPFLLDLYLRVTKIIYAGTKHQCPCCSGKFNRFLSFRGYEHLRKNARCPGCGSLERHRLLWLFLKNKTNLLKDELSVLHFAPEPVLQKKLSSLSSIKYISADLYSPMAMVKMDITEIPYKENTIDAVLCSHVLNHVHDDNKAMRELYRIIKPDGWVIIQSPVDYNKETFEDATAVTAADKLRTYGQIDLARLYGKDFVERLARAGFQVDRINYAGDFSPTEKEYYGLPEIEDIYYCTKS